MFRRIFQLNKTTRRSFCNKKKEHKIKIYLSNITNPAINSAIEKWLIQNNNSSQILYMWQNDPSVFIGRNQNPYKECNVQNMERDNIVLMHGQSGRGAVYHDLGNTNFSFITRTEDYDRNINYSIIVSALKLFGIDARVKGRNDIVVMDRKVCVTGSAYQHTKNLFVHHGTLSVDIDTSALTEYLKPNKKKLESKEVTSIETRVSNLVEFNPYINHQNVVCAIILQFIKTYRDKMQISDFNIDSITDLFWNSCLHRDASHPYYMLPDVYPDVLRGLSIRFEDSPVPLIIIDRTFVKNILLHDPTFTIIYDAYMNWYWNYGKELCFVRQIDNYFSWGSVAIYIEINSNHGLIEQISITSDSLYPDMIDTLSKHLKNKRYHADGIYEALVLTCREISKHATFDEFEKEICQRYASELCNWFVQQI